MQSDPLHIANELIKKNSWWVFVASELTSFALAHIDKESASDEEFKAIAIAAYYFYACGYMCLPAHEVEQFSKDMEEQEFAIPVTNPSALNDDRKALGMLDLARLLYDVVKYRSKVKYEEDTKEGSTYIS